MRTLALVVLLLGAPAAASAAPTPPDPWFGADKVKHFFMSAFVHSGTYSALRAAELSRSNARLVAGVTSLTLGIARETYDRRRGRVFSLRDLAWDAAGILAAAAVLNGTR